MKAEILNTRDRRVVADVRALVRRLNRELKPGPCKVNVVLVTDVRMQELNRRFLKRNRPTDVLAFPLGAESPGRPSRLLGEVYVSRDRAREQAKQYRVKFHDEVRRLVLHGILHLLELKHAEMVRFYDRYLDRAEG